MGGPSRNFKCLSCFFTHGIYFLCTNMRRLELDLHHLIGGDARDADDLECSLFC